MEDVLKDIAETVDGSVPPQGISWHQYLLDQMSTAIEARRESVLDPDLSAALTELKGFRHVVRHNYGLDLNPARTETNYNLMTTTFPKFVEAIAALDIKLSEEPNASPEKTHGR
jgi:hypothetical protein